MNRLLMFLLMAFPGIAIFAQTTPEAFLGMVPPTPTNCCYMKHSEKDAYRQKHNDFTDKIKAEISRRKKASTVYLNKNSEAIRTGAAMQAGYDQKTAEQMKNMTPEQRKAAASKMMQEKYNFSMEDAQNLKKMTKEQREAWAKAHSGQIMADAQANPGKYRNQNNQGKEMMDVAQQITALNQSFQAKEQEFQQRINKVKNDPEAIKTRNEIDKLQSKLTSMMGVVSDADAKKMDQMAVQIKTLKKQYCAKYSPQYLEIANDYLAYLKNSMPDFYKLEDLQEKQFQLQTGNKSPMGEKGLYGIEVVGRYADISAGILEFDLSNDSEKE